MNQTVRISLAIFALALFLTPLTAGEQGQITIPRTDKVVVLTLDLSKGDIVDFSWSANSSVTFRVENLAGTNTFVDRAGQTGSGNWEVMADGSYTFEFRNPSDLPVTVHWEITRRPVLAASLVYSLVALAIAALAFAAFIVLRKKHVK